MNGNFEKDPETKEESEFISSLGLLSTKPKIIVCNVDENSVSKGNKYSDSIKNEYPNEKASMDTNTFFLFLTDNIMDVMKLTKQNALREAKAIVEEKKEVIDGDYALFLDTETKKNYI